MAVSPPKPYCHTNERQMYGSQSNQRFKLWGVCLLDMHSFGEWWRENGLIYIWHKEYSAIANMYISFFSFSFSFLQYCPIPVISYPQLENELFCSIYYLRHLCNTERFPNWPIRNPVSLRSWRQHLSITYLSLIYHAYLSRVRF